MLQFDISDVTREGIGVCCQLMMGQSSVPHYQQLEEFTARLAPGEVSRLAFMCSTMLSYTCSTRSNAVWFVIGVSVCLCVHALR